MGLGSKYSKEFGVSSDLLGQFHSLTWITRVVGAVWAQRIRVVLLVSVSCLERLLCKDEQQSPAMGSPWVTMGPHGKSKNVGNHRF